MTEDEERTQIHALLKGYAIVDDTRPVRTGYKIEGNHRVKVELPALSGIAYFEQELEDETRRSLAELLRSKNPLHRHIRDALADLIEPEPREYSTEQRQLVFKFRARGKRPNSLFRTQIATFVFEQEAKGGKIEAVVQSAMDQFKISRSEVNRVRKEYRPFFLALGILTE